MNANQLRVNAVRVNHEQVILAMRVPRSTAVVVVTHCQVITLAVAKVGVLLNDTADEE